MTKTFRMAALLLLLAATASAGETGNAARGKTLHDPGCLGDCHAGRTGGAANDLYTRENRRMDSLEKLRAQVAFCNQQVLGSEWFPEDEADVVAYLNGAFYHFTE